ncbi:NADH dehydrogenase [ubiquinone] 1 alpha subcomplex subunit 2 [Onthophagus taurus]|uniref:NADH dehydrogenase [ubiquinone] 1 alpha subcomplex subunit 2 n=1 Tax=Onthophagus taurus TaxID=166361 RepID=UPI000C1FEDBD|nr:NADH dehydrogenase [ubiquinone] 1 alpha subcomplex subunit 2 [Onthophagus taurus]
MGSKALKFGSRLKELRLHLCQRGETSKGAREFVEKFYVGIKSQNPTFPILVRECSSVEPKLWARYEKGKETSVSLKNMSAEDIYTKLEQVAK